MFYYVTVDVPDLENGIRFYSAVFGFEETSRPFPGGAMLGTGDLTMGLRERAEGTQPIDGCDDTVRFARHWTPVHMDVHVDDFDATLERARTAGATVEQVYPAADHPAAAFCADPFGNGFCIIGPSMNA